MMTCTLLILLLFPFRPDTIQCFLLPARVPDLLTCDVAAHSQTLRGMMDCKAMREIGAIGVCDVRGQHMVTYRTR